MTGVVARFGHDIHLLWRALNTARPEIGQADSMRRCTTQRLRVMVESYSDSFQFPAEPSMHIERGLV